VILRCAQVRSALGARKGKQPFDIVFIDLEKRGQVFLTCLLRLDQIGTSPGEARTPQLPGEEIGCQASMPAIPVGKGMNCGKPVVKADRDFIGIVGLILDPEPDIIDQLLSASPRPRPVAHRLFAVS
tara:strand:- start:10693 stop:11073 length:381 start_codon:yes stop_codon:yes gene_type:complete